MQVQHGGDDARSPDLRQLVTLQSRCHALRSLDGRGVDLLSSQVRMMAEQLQFLISCSSGDDDSPKS